MKGLLWLILLVLAALGVVAIVDYTGVYDVPMIDVSQENAAEAVTPSD